MPRDWFYWILVEDPETHKKSLLSGGDTENIARQKGLECLSGLDFEIRKLPTRNQQRASAMVRGKRLEETHSLSQASQRLGHEKTVQRRLRKLQGNRY